MRGLRCEFWADADDLAALVQAFGQLGPCQFVEIHSALNQPNLILEDAATMLPAAMVSPAAPHRRFSFLVMEAGATVRSRTIIRSDGSGTINCADQNNNWDSVVIAFGGDAGEQTLVMSDINTVGDTPTARRLHRMFKALVRANTRRFGPKGAPAWLMPGAIAKARAGWRLAREKGWLPTTDPVLLLDADDAG
jgi:hypothetical protein